jgi:hypothetical protein
MFDQMMGMYDYSAPATKIHTYLLFGHIFFANVFMLNYLVAILTTVYENMMELGDFAFKCNKYWYIERYLIA